MFDTEAHRNLVPAAPRLPFVLMGLGAMVLLLGIVWPHSDLIVAGWFHRPAQGFFLENVSVFVFIHWLAYYGARALGLFLAVCVSISYFRKATFLSVTTKGWAFLFLGLLLAPGLVGNALFKDHWGRARPHEVTEFGGTQAFSPALVPQPEPRHNGSFVSGDGSFGFYLPSVAYIIPSGPDSRRRGYVFWGGMFAGALFGFTRIVMGSHFLSDVLFAALLMLLTMALLHAVMFGRDATRQCWREWMGLKRGPALSSQS